MTVTATQTRLPAAERRRQILDVALEVFARHGYHDTSMNALASEAGVTKPVLYQHFVSKHDLFEVLLTETGDRLMRAIEAAEAEETPRRQVEAGFRAFFHFFDERPAAFSVLYGSSLAVTRKHYLKSGHLPRELDNPEDEANGLKMVYLEGMELGDTELGGMGGLVFVNAKPDANLGSFLEGTGFEIGGYVNTRLMSTWSVTYAPASGKVFVKTP